MKKYLIGMFLFQLFLAAWLILAFMLGRSAAELLDQKISNIDETTQSLSRDMLMMREWQQAIRESLDSNKKR